MESKDGEKQISEAWPKPSQSLADFLKDSGLQTKAEKERQKIKDKENEMKDLDNVKSDFIDVKKIRAQVKAKNGSKANPEDLPDVEVFEKTGQYLKKLKQEATDLQHQQRQQFLSAIGESEGENQITMKIIENLEKIDRDVLTRYVVYVCVRFVFCFALICFVLFVFVFVCPLKFK